MRTEWTPDGFKHYLKCGLCHRDFLFGPHRYAGRPIKSWGIMVCEQCESANHDGVVRESHAYFFQALGERGIDVTTNERGWVALPR